jgi:hypothetical protein
MHYPQPQAFRLVLREQTYPVQVHLVQRQIAGLRFQAVRHLQQPLKVCWLKARQAAQGAARRQALAQRFTAAAQAVLQSSHLPQVVNVAAVVGVQPDRQVSVKRVVRGMALQQTRQVVAVVAAGLTQEALRRDR